MSNNKTLLNSLHSYYDRFYSLGFNLEPGQPLGAFEKQQLDIYQQQLQSTQGLRGTGLLRNWHIARFYYLRLISNYFSGEYKPESDNEELLLNLRDIWCDFIDGWYFGTIYIGYGDSLLNYEKALWESKGKPEDYYRCKWENPIRLYKLDGYTKDGRPLFVSVFSKLRGIEIPREELIECSCNSNINWLLWWDLMGEYTAGLSGIPQSIKATRKTWIAFIKDRHKFISEVEQLENPESFMVKSIAGDDIADTSIFKPAQFGQLDAPQIQLKNVEAYFEHRAAWLGFTGKGSNNKSERLLAGEIYQDMKLIANIQEANVRRLKVIFKRLSSKHSLDDIDVVLTGGTLAQGLPQSLNNEMNPINNNLSIQKNKQPKPEQETKEQEQN